MVLGAILVLLGDAAYVAFTLQSSLPDVEAELDRGATELREGRLSAAASAMDEALDAARSAERASDHPSLLLASLLPRMGDDVRALRSLADSSVLAGEAGVEVIAAARAAGAKDGDIAGSLYADGRVRFDVARRTLPHIEKAGELMALAEDEMAAAPDPDVEALADPFYEAAGRISDGAEAATKGAIAVRALPGLLAEDSSRRYLLAFHSPSEARGGGGIIGMMGVLQARDGRLGLGRIIPTSHLLYVKLKPVDAPEWFAKTYGSLSALREFPQSNLSPHFPVTAEVLLQMFEQRVGSRLSGVIAMDPLVFGEMLRSTGPISVAGSDLEVTPENAKALLLRDSYLRFDSKSQDRFLGELIDEFWGRIHAGDFEPAEFARALADGVSSRRFKVYARTEDDQEALRRMGAAGAIPPDAPNLQMVFGNQFSGSKVDYFLHREIETVVTLDRAGNATVTTTAVVHNRAPDGPPSLLLGPHPAYPKDRPGLNRMNLSFLMPRGAELDSLTLNGDPTDPIFGTEGAYPLATQVVEVPAGASAGIAATYRLPGAVGEDDTMAMTMLPQPTVNPDRYSITVLPPYGYGATIENLDFRGKETARMSGVLDEPKHFEITMGKLRQPSLGWSSTTRSAHEHLLEPGVGVDLITSFVQ